MTKTHLVIPKRTCTRCKEKPRVKGSWCRDCHNEWSRKSWSKKPKEIRQEKWLKHRYGKDYKWYKNTWENQGGQCAICEREIFLSGGHGPQKACVDHDHTTGQVRGLLCNHCNRALGLFQDNRRITSAATQYLDYYEGDES